MCGLKFFVPQYQAYGTLLADYFKREENNNRDKFFGKDSSLHHTQDSNCFNDIGGEKGFNSALCILINFGPSNFVTALVRWLGMLLVQWLVQLLRQQKRLNGLSLSCSRWKDISNSRTRPKVLISNVSYFCLSFLFSGRVWRAIWYCSENWRGLVFKSLPDWTSIYTPWACLESSKQ